MRIRVRVLRKGTTRDMKIVDRRSTVNALGAASRSCLQNNKTTLIHIAEHTLWPAILLDFSKNKSEIFGSLFIQKTNCSVGKVKPSVFKNRNIECISIFLTKPIL